MGKITFCGVEGCPFDIDAGPPLHVLVTDLSGLSGTYQADVYVCTQHRKAMAEPVVAALAQT